jgi:hypothetical protein
MGAVRVRRMYIAGKPVVRRCASASDGSAANGWLARFQSWVSLSIPALTGAVVHKESAEPLSRELYAHDKWLVPGSSA